jgi:hypothetical protein
MPQCQWSYAGNMEYSIEVVLEFLYNELEKRNIRRNRNETSIACD